MGIGSKRLPGRSCLTHPSTTTTTTKYKTHNNPKALVYDKRRNDFGQVDSVRMAQMMSLVARGGEWKSCWQISDAKINNATLENEF